MTSEHPAPRVAVAVDAAAHALATTVPSLVLASATSAVVSERFWPGVEVVLFLVGWLLFGYATLLAWPASRRPGRTPLGRLARIDSGLTTGPREEGPLERTVARLLPGPWALAPDERLSSATKLYLSSLAVLSTSVAIERLLVV